MVPQQVLAEGEETVLNFLRSQLAHALARFILDSKILNGADRSGFLMEYEPMHDAMRITVRGYFLTPQEFQGRFYMAASASPYPLGYT